ncbi:hypothetical protein ABBQ38_013861 [Trebouxia sp. C0009 RCD-2024]
MASNLDDQLLTVLLSGPEEAQVTALLQNAALPERLPRKRKRAATSVDSLDFSNEETAIFQHVSEPCHNKQQPTRPACSSSYSNSGSAMKADTSTPADLCKSQHETVTTSAFSRDDPLIPELLSWISCTAILGGLAASVALASCCEAIRQASGCAPASSLQYGDSDSDGELQFDEQLAMCEESTQAQQALDEVLDYNASSSQGLGTCLLPGLKRRNSGKRNLHKPWTQVEEAELVRLVDQADYRKQVLSVSRLSKGGWTKIAHHLGRAGPSAVQNITFKYRSLKKQAGTHASTGALTGRAAQGLPAVSPALCSPFSGIQGTDTPAAAVAVAPSPGTKGTGKRHKVTACALAIMGLQQSPEEQGTAKEIMAAIEADSALAQHLNWDKDQTGKVRWRTGVTCALSADKSGIFKKTGRKHEGQIVWQLDNFKAKFELQRYSIAEGQPH